MVSLRKLRKVFRGDSTAHIHPQKKDDDLINVQRMEKILRERHIKTRPFHVKFVGCTLLIGPRLTQARAEEVARTIMKNGRKTNKRQVTFNFFPEKIYVTDMIYRCCLAQFHMDEIGQFFVYPHDRRLFAVLVKDIDTCGYTFFLYKCTVKGFKCGNEEVMEQYVAMYEEYKIIEPDFNHDHHHHHEQFIHHEHSADEIPYYEKLRNARAEASAPILNKSLFMIIEKPSKISFSVSTTQLDPDLASEEEEDDDDDDDDSMCESSSHHRHQHAEDVGHDEQEDSAPQCKKKVRPPRPIRRPILLKLLTCAPSSVEIQETPTASSSSQQSATPPTTLTPPSPTTLTPSSPTTLTPLRTHSILKSHKSHLSPSPKENTSLVYHFPSVTLSTDNLKHTLPPTLNLSFSHPTYTFTLSSPRSSTALRPYSSISNIKFRISPCSLILTPSSHCLITHLDKSSLLDTSLSSISPTLSIASSHLVPTLRVSPSSFPHLQLPLAPSLLTHTYTTQSLLLILPQTPSTLSPLCPPTTLIVSPHSRHHVHHHQPATLRASLSTHRFSSSSSTSSISNSSVNLSSSTSNSTVNISSPTSNSSVNLSSSTSNSTVNISSPTSNSSVNLSSSTSNSTVNISSPTSNSSVNLSSSTSNSTVNISSPTSNSSVNLSSSTSNSTVNVSTSTSNSSVNLLSSTSYSTVNVSTSNSNFTSRKSTSAASLQRIHVPSSRPAPPHSPLSSIHTVLQSPHPPTSTSTSELISCSTTQHSSSVLSPPPPSSLSPAPQTPPTTIQSPAQALDEDLSQHQCPSMTPVEKTEAPKRRIHPTIRKVVEKLENNV